MAVVVKGFILGETIELDDGTTLIVSKVSGRHGKKYWIRIERDTDIGKVTIIKQGDTDGNK